MSIGTPITSFRGEFFFLSNFYPCQLAYLGHSYPTAEHAFQAAKAGTEEDRRRVAVARTPGAAKQMGKQIGLRSGWEKAKIRVMAEVIREKFKEPGLRKWLLATKDRLLVEGNDWHDYFWGVCGGKGENWLGELLMAERERCQEEDEEDRKKCAGRWWISCPRFTVSLALDSNGVIMEAAPFVRKFLGQHKDRLTAWAGKFGEVRWERLVLRDISPGIKACDAPQAPRAPKTKGDKK